MLRLLLAFLCFTATVAWAALTPLPGSTPQRALAGETFPNPIRLRVTDDAGAPVSGAVVSWHFPTSFLGGVATFDLSPCSRDPFEASMTCRLSTNADGIVEVRGLYGVFPGTFSFHFKAFRAVDLGTAVVVLHSDPRVPPVQLVAVSGNGQRAVMGNRFPEPLVVRVLTRDGVPLEGIPVQFDPQAFDDDTRGFRHPSSSRGWVDTDEQGLAVSPPIASGWVPGKHTLSASLYDPDARAYVTLKVEAVVTDARGEFDVALTNMWWAGPVETGWGMSVVKHGDQLFNVLFVYDDEGKPTWYVQPGGTWSEGVGSMFGGRIYSPRSSPWFA